MAPFYYDAYGLRFCSDVPLPELRSTEATQADVRLSCRRLNWTPPAVDAWGTCFHFTSEGAYLHWQQVGTFFVGNGDEIVVDSFGGVSEDLVRLPLLGTVLAVLLHQRGYLVLHASAVSLDDGVAIFLGGKGEGKSTMAAALYADGHSLVADDVVAVDLTKEHMPSVLPGFPRFKLWPDAANAALGDDGARLPRIASGMEKRVRSADERMALAALPLQSVFVLGSGQHVQLTHLHPQQALVNLITHSYVARFGQQLLHDGLAAMHLQQCAHIVSSVPVYVLERPRAIELLPRIVRSVQACLSPAVP